MSNYSSSQYQPNVIWTVAGSDSCAGAGLQTDLHTFHDFNLVGCSVVRCSYQNIQSPCRPLRQSPL
ncbi:TPA: hypothetical protein ACK3JR_001955 [Mannheimia haemolytica]